tara:strand:- start:23616 stop:24005 length:390 start_codon:yes stop_codon:yes gene_type:complete
MTVIAFIVLFITGMAAGFYICTQISDKHAHRFNEMRTKPVRILVSYVEQGPGRFYGMYIYDDIKDQWYCKFSSLVEANAILQSYGIKTPLPESISERGSTTKLDMITKRFTWEHADYVEFDWNQCMDVS